MSAIPKAKYPHSPLIFRKCNLVPFPSALKTAKDVNAAFKESVRKKYSKSWDFLQTNMGHISMLDSSNMERFSSIIVSSS